MNNKTQFSGLWGVVLGGSSGLGYAAVKKLSQHGMNLAVLYRETAANEKNLKQNLTEMASASDVVISPYNINALEADDREKFSEQFAAATGGNKVRLLLHSIARGNLKPLVAQRPDNASSAEEVLSVDDIQLTTYAMSTSLLDWARIFLEKDLFCDDARIIGLTSEGANKYWDSYAAVSVAKASLASLATYMAVEFGKYGIKTNLVQAGVTNTPSMNRIPGSEKLVEMTTARNPLGRMTRPEDIANAIYLLTLDEASWINGALIHVDGGEHAVNFKIP